MPFGLGTRQCIARTMAMYQMHLALYELVRADCFRGARPAKQRIEISETFNAKVIGGAIDIVW